MYQSERNGRSRNQNIASHNAPPTMLDGSKLKRKPGQNGWHHVGQTLPAWGPQMRINFTLGTSTAAKKRLSPAAGAGRCWRAATTHQLEACKASHASALCQRHNTKNTGYDTWTEQTRRQNTDGKMRKRSDIKAR